MKGYIEEILIKFGHSNPKKPQSTPYKYQKINYGAKQQLTPADYTSPELNEKGIRRVQDIVGALLYYDHAVEKKLLFGIRAIGYQQAAATESTAEDIDHLLDCCSVYPNDGNVFCASDMELAAHYDLGFNNEYKARSQAGAHIFLSKNDQVPRWN